MLTADVTSFTEETLNGKLHFLCSVSSAKTFGFWLEIFRLIQIRNKRVSKTEPSGTPIFMLTNFEH